jgi:hypothetical protein
MPWVGFEPTILAFEQAKTVHALDREANVVGYSQFGCINLISKINLICKCFIK